MEDLTKFYTGPTVLRCSNGFYLENMLTKDVNEAFSNREDIFGIYNSEDQCIGYLKESNDHPLEYDYGILIRYEAHQDERELGQSNFLEKICEFLFRKHVTPSAEFLVVQTSHKEHLFKFSSVLLEDLNNEETRRLENLIQKRRNECQIDFRGELSLFRDQFYKRFSNYTPNRLPESEDSEQITKYLLDITIFDLGIDATFNTYVDNN